MFGHPVTELVQDVEGGVKGAADCGVVSFAFAVVFPPGHMDGCGAVKAWDAVSGVEIEPDVAQLEGDEFGDPEAADGGECDHKAVAVIAVGVRPQAQHGGDHQAVDGEEQGGGAPH
jgi:hypothetical protein